MARRRRHTQRPKGTKFEPKVPIAETFLPNHSGDHSRGRVNTTPTTDYEIANKKYVDDSITTQSRYWDFTLLDPNGLYDVDTQVFIGWATQALTITKIQVECSADPTTEITGDLKYADDFIALTNATVINDFDTTAGKRTDTSITSASVASGKAIYIQFDAQPEAALAQIHFHIEYDFD